MKIDHIEIEYFKFIENLFLNLYSKNCLIYGENGSGKSSLFEAIYSVFYHRKRLEKNIKVSNIFKNRNHKSKDLKVKISLNKSKEINRINEEVEGLDIFPSINLNIGKIKEYKSTMLCANEKVLNRLIKENFYIAIRCTLIEHFPDISLLSNNYREFEDLDIIVNKTVDQIEKKEGKNKKDIDNFEFKLRSKLEEELKILNNTFKIHFENQIAVDNINEILKKELKEDITISFDIKDAHFQAIDKLVFVQPFIRIKIDGLDIENKLYMHYNEAKLKLISIAIYFAMAKKYENPKGFNLLVLDDFITSLDMANRKLIVQYILDKFKDYQKIILTHNIQFYNIFNKLIQNNKQKEDWIVKTIFNFENRAYIKDESIDYLEKAKSYLSNKNYDLQATGIYLRKEFEAICAEFEQLLNLGKKENLQNIIDKLKKPDEYYVDSHNKIKEFISHFNNTFGNIGINSDKKLEIIKNKIEDFDKIKFDNKFYTVLNKTEFYKNILLNTTAHNDADTDIFKKEAEKTIELLKYLKKELNKLRNEGN